jgi:NAD(P)-dependent dehydrogenase (short-subunit alcohol dehydrogenase family)
VALVTGGSGGIGQATALAFAREGAKVVIAARREEQGVQVVKAIQAAGGTASFVRTDVSKEADVAAAVAHAVKTYGQLDVLFNNAGTEGKNAPIADLEGADFDATFLTNVKAVWLLMKHALPHLAKTKGAIVNNGSVVADIGMAGTTVYSASKGAVHAMTRTAAIEFIKSGVRVNAVSPGPTLTEMTGRMFGSQDNFRAFAKSAVPAGAPGRVEDIADAVLYLASAPFVVGQILTVDGGLSAQ